MELLDQLLEARPGVAGALTALSEPAVEMPHAEERLYWMPGRVRWQTGQTLHLLFKILGLSWPSSQKNLSMR